ncbi:hypothetical protein pb186bvf_010815 [Paramecium bursaria]
MMPFEEQSQTIFRINNVTYFQIQSELHHRNHSIIFRIIKLINRKQYCAQIKIMTEQMSNIDQSIILTQRYNEQYMKQLRIRENEKTKQKNGIKQDLTDCAAQIIGQCALKVCFAMTKTHFKENQNLNTQLIIEEYQVYLRTILRLSNLNQLD